MVALAAISLAALTGAAATRAARDAWSGDIAAAPPVVHHAPPPPPPPPMTALGDSMLGVSGRLRAAFVPAADLESLVGGARPDAPGTYTVPGGIGGHPFTLLAVHDFSLKVGASVDGYYVGYWPAERRRVHSLAYANPEGFIEVTPANEDTYVSEHFRLRDFVTHDQQQSVWPKYVVLSGFRTPAYNLALGDASGRARESRHQYGDAADIIIDADGDGRMDDLNWDGRVDAGDVRVIEQAVERVEWRHPELVGGLGLYDSMGPHGPFAHIDVRGEAARWTRWRGSGTRRGATGGDPARATRVGSCWATGPSAVLCAHLRRAR